LPIEKYLVILKIRTTNFIEIRVMEFGYNHDTICTIKCVKYNYAICYSSLCCGRCL